MNLTEFKRSSLSDPPHYLLLGNPVGHSWSPLMHNTALSHYGIDAEYHAIAVESNELGDLAAHMNKESFLGANITIPYKQLIMDYLDRIDPSAKKIGAVNTILKNDFQLEGLNTDSYGFAAPLGDYEDEFFGTDAIVFGTGGASRAIVVSLIEMGLETIYLVSRSPNRINSFDEWEQVRVVSYHDWTSFLDEVYLIINATPLGMHPKVNESPVRDLERDCLEGRICYDLVYNPMRTKFLTQAEEVGATTIGGLEMLIQQGNQSFKLWTGRSFPLEIVRNKLYDKLEN